MCESGNWRIKQMEIAEREAAILGHTLPETPSGIASLMFSEGEIAHLRRVIDALPDCVVSPLLSLIGGAFYAGYLLHAGLLNESCPECSCGELEDNDGDE